MASISTKRVVLFSLIAIFSTCLIVKACDPDILSDFIVSQNSTTPVGKFFTFTKRPLLAPMCVRLWIYDSAIPNCKVTKASKAEFPALVGQSVSFAILDRYPASGVNPLRIHPQASELLFVLVHYQYNSDSKVPATVVGSASAGTLSLPTTLFDTKVENAVLVKLFKTNVATIKKLKAGLAHKG
ncbi:hypothetical protein ACJIZ3_012171 [Penstemon smallii]|uniref:Uncharacterized protein n=1 Tax=Penstemon smallii TaxID=265156 RepID=A0ABD3UL77_9LAMI